MFHFSSLPATALSLKSFFSGRICQGLTFPHRPHPITPNAPSKERSFIRSLFLIVSINLSIKTQICLAEGSGRFTPGKASQYPLEREMGQGCTNARRPNFCTGASVRGSAVWRSLRVTLLEPGSFENLWIPVGWSATSMWTLWRDKNKPLSCGESNPHPSIPQAIHYTD